jgi:nitroimidazol reductase NimA-like FMN-containing flavoprotein (pyridoxamine 5'-phosphate oxidase superfamily)
MSTSLPLDHSGLAVLPKDECLRRLRRARVGRVAFVERGEPVIFPVNHGMDGDAVVFLTAPGSKLSAAEDGVPVAFEVDGYDPDRRAGWSVLVRGSAITVEEQVAVKRLNQLGVSPWADLVERTHWVQIKAYSLTGREVVHPAR